jgi:hypothetical protein
MKKIDRRPPDYLPWLPPKPATFWRWLETTPRGVQKLCATVAMAVSGLCGLLGGLLGADVVAIILFDRPTIGRIQIESGLATVLIGIGAKLYSIAKSRPLPSKART